MQNALSGTQWMSGIGAIAALGSALCWAISATLFKSIGEFVPATAMNLFKGLIALAMLGLIAVGGFVPVERQGIYILAVSGLLGICVGDTLYFMALMRLGARVTLLVGMLIPVVAAILAVILFQEKLPIVAWLGLAMTLSGVGYVLWERASCTQDRIRWSSGLWYGFLFVLLNAIAVVLTKIGVAEIPALEATLIRQLAAIIGLFFWGVVTANLMNWTLTLRNRYVLKQLVIAAFIGAFLGTWLSIVALKYTQTAVAATLSATSPLFILPIMILVLKVKVSMRAIGGAVFAWLGIGVYFVSFLSAN